MLGIMVVSLYTAYGYVNFFKNDNEDLGALNLCGSLLKYYIMTPVLY